MKERFRSLIWPAYVVLLALTACGTLVVEVSAHAGHTHHYGITPVAAQVSCSTIKQTRTIHVTMSAFSPKVVTAHLCDEIIFQNDANMSSDVAMGPHEQHLAYPGLSATPLLPGKSEPIILVTAGTFPLHEHLRDVATGTLIIER